MKSTIARRALAALACSALAGCGGGGSDGDRGSSSPAPVERSAAEGSYDGTTDTGLSIGGVVLETGEFAVLYRRGETIEGVVQGTSTATNGTIASSDAFDYFLVLQLRLPATVTGSYVPRQSLDGAVAAGGQTVRFTSRYQPGYDTPASLAAVAGTYAGSATARGGPGTLTASVTAGGGITGTTSGGGTTCTFAGTLAPRASGKNVFDLSVRFGGGGCVLGTASVSGYAVPVDEGGVRRLYAVGLLPDRSNAFVAVGRRQ